MFTFCKTTFLTTGLGTICLKEEGSREKEKFVGKSKTVEPKNALECTKCILRG